MNSTPVRPSRLASGAHLESQIDTTDAGTLQTQFILTEGKVIAKQKHLPTTIGAMARQIRFHAYHVLIPVLLLVGVWALLLAQQGRLALLAIYVSRLACVMVFALSLSAAGFLVLPKSRRTPLLCFTTGLIVYYYLLFLLGIFHLY